MAKASRVALGGLSGAAGGAGIGSAFLPGVGTAIGAGVGGLVGLLGSAFGDDGASEEDIAKQREFLARRQALEREGSYFNNEQRMNARMGSMFDGQPSRGDIFATDPQLATRPAQIGMERRGQQLETDMFNERARLQQEGEDTKWQDWVGPIMGGASAVAGAMKSDPYAARKQQLWGKEQAAGGSDWSGALPGVGNAVSGAYRYTNGTADEADYIDASGLSGTGLATAQDENDERTRTALFGSKRRMNPYEF